MILHDFHCTGCSLNFTDFTTYDEEAGAPRPAPCPNCATPSPRVFLPRGYHHAVMDKSERTVYDIHPVTGDIKIPGRADTPMHPVRRAQGYERRECTTIQDVVRLERMTGKLSERLHYDKGSGTRRPDGIDVD